MPRKRYPTIKEGADGLWHAWVTVGTKPNGRPEQRHIKRATKTEVEDRVDELLDQRKNGTVVKAGRPTTVEQWLTTYLEVVAPRRIDPSTAYGYASKMRNWVYPTIGKIRLDRLAAEHLDLVYLTMQRAGKADATVLQVHRILTRALHVAYQRAMIPRNMRELVDPPKAKKKEMTPLTEDEANALLNAAQRRRNAARWSVGLGLGLRQGEVLGLRWPYLDLDGGEMRVWWQLHRRSFEHGCGGSCGRRRAGNCPGRTLRLRTGEQQLEGGLLLKEPKGTGKRTIPLPPEIVAELRAHREVQDLEKVMAGPAYAGHGLVFADIDGTPIDPARDWAEHRLLVKAAGIRADARVHDDRHTAATILIALGVRIEVVQELLGHSSITVTRGYVHVASKMAREATDQMGKSLFGRRGTP